MLKLKGLSTMLKQSVQSKHTTCCAMDKCGIFQGLNSECCLLESWSWHLASSGSLFKDAVGLLKEVWSFHETLQTVGMPRRVWWRSVATQRTAEVD